MRRSSLAVQVVLLIVTIVSLTALVHAQYGASLQGTVTDKSGAVVKGAKVTVTNQATGATQTTETSGAGLFRIAALTPGQYTVDVESGGFRKSHLTNVQVDAESVRGLDVALETGAAQETVMVTSEGSGVQSHTISAGSFRRWRSQWTWSGTIITKRRGTWRLKQFPLPGREPDPGERQWPAGFR